MNAPVDVLAVRAQEILHETNTDGSRIDRENLAIRIARMEQRDAAVAELIEAAGTLDRIERGLWHERGRQEAVTKLCAALAKVQP